MQTKAALLITALSLGIFSAVLVHALWYAPEAQVNDIAIVHASSTAAVLPADSTDYPEHLSIPSLNIDANVQRVGIGKSGSIAVPSNFTDVAWYRLGSLPGQGGTAVFDGHVDNGLSLAGVFKHLDTVQIGSDIFIQTLSGIKLHYVVSDIELYQYQNVPMADIVTTTGAPRLALITCDGAWVQGQRTYDHRLVVYAKLVS